MEAQGVFCKCVLWRTGVLGKTSDEIGLRELLLIWVSNHLRQGQVKRNGFEIVGGCGSQPCYWRTACRPMERRYGAGEGSAITFCWMPVFPLHGSFPQDACCCKAIAMALDVPWCQAVSKTERSASALQTTHDRLHSANLIRMN